MRFAPFALAAWLVACGGAAGRDSQRGVASPADEADPAFSAYAATHGIRTLNGGGEPTEVFADGLRLERVDKERPVKLDGVLGEWPAMTKTTVTVRGANPKIGMSVGLMVDDAKLYVGADVSDPGFVAGRDHVSLILAVPEPGGAHTVYNLALYAGKPGESEGSVRFGRRGQVPGAKIVEAPSGSGYSLEASVPWSALPQAHITLVGIRGVAQYVTNDSVVATGPGDGAHPLDMPWVPSEPELAMIEQLLAPKGLAKIPPEAEIIADLTGDGVRERVAVFDHYLTICGTSFLGGNAFFYRDLVGELVKVEVRDVTGRGKEDVIARRRASMGDGTREYLEVLSVLDENQEPRVTFAHEIGVRQSDRRVDDAVRLGHGTIEVSVEPPTGWDVATYSEPTATDVAPILLPWGAVRSETWRWDGSRFARSHEVFQKEQRPPGDVAGRPADSEDPSVPPRPPEPPTPKVARGGALAGDLLAVYRRDRGIGSDLRPKVDLQVQVAGDEQPERVLLIGRDIVVLGPGFKGGSAYSYATLAPFEDASDIKDLSARDLTGDGKADLIVRGVRHPGGARPPVDSEILLVYQVDDAGGITRVFGIETAREQGAKRVQGLVQFIPSAGAKTFDVVAAPGRATGWTRKTYPWPQEPPGGSADLEPLLLPWGGVKSVRYSWNGSQFVPGAE